MQVGAMRYPASITLLILSFCLYLAALCNDGFYIQAENPRAWSPGWGLLLVGWVALTLLVGSIVSMLESRVPPAGQTFGNVSSDAAK
jgi:hypothetical protein